MKSPKFYSFKCECIEIGTSGERLAQNNIYIIKDAQNNNVDSNKPAYPVFKDDTHTHTQKATCSDELKEATSLV